MTVHSDISMADHEGSRGSLGDELRAARAARGLSVSDVEADLRIKAYYIEAIENGDRAALPDKVYVDGFVRNYATYLQLDPEEILARFNDESDSSTVQRKGFSRVKPVREAAAQNPLAGYTPPRRSGGEAGPGGLARGLVSLWPLVVLAGLGYAIWYGVIAAREAGIIPDNLSVIGAAEIEPPVFTANISDQAIDGGDADDTIERPADLSYAKLGAPPYWTLPEDSRASDGPLYDIDVASVGLFSAHRDMMGGSALIRNAAPIDLTPASPAATAMIAAETRAVLLSDTGPVPSVAESHASGLSSPARDFALVAVEETWIELKAPSGRVRFSGILAPEEAFEIPPGDTLVLKVGNAGGLVLELDGMRHGPFGARGAVMRNIAMDRMSLRDRFSPRIAGTATE